MVASVSSDAGRATGGGMLVTALVRSGDFY